MTKANIDSVLGLYFETDRSSVKSHYESLFKMRIHENGNESENEEIVNDESSNDPKSLEEDLDARFIEVIRVIGANVYLTNRLVQQWETMEDEEKVIGLHYFASLFDTTYSIEHAVEGMVRFFTPWGATPMLHAMAPTVVLPIDGELSYSRIRQILDLLGIEFDDSKNCTEFMVIMNIGNAIFEWAEEREFEPWQTWAAIFDLGPRLVHEKFDFSVNHKKRVWIVATNNSPGAFNEVDEDSNKSIGTWAINPKAKKGDLALMYCVSPRSAFVGVYRVLEDSHRDPFGGWNDHRAEIGQKISIPWLKFSDMKDDSVLGDWKLLRSNFQGLLRHEVPEEVWNHIKEIVSASEPETGQRLNALGDAATGVREIRTSSEKWSEKEVEDQLIIPLLEKLGWQTGKTMLQQVEMLIKVGSGQPRKVFADFVGYTGALTSEATLVVEAKRKISGTKDLKFAKEQAESYAGKLRCPRFAVAAPEGIWIYTLSFPGQSELIGNFKLEGEPVETIAEKTLSLLGFESCFPK